MYGAERCTLSQSDELYILLFGCRVLRKMDGIIQEGGVWRHFDLYNTKHTLIQACLAR